MGSPSLLAGSLRSIVDAVQRGSDGGTVAMSVTRAPDEVHLRVASPGRWRGAPPALNEGQGFAEALRSPRGHSLALAKLTIEQFGGTLHLVEEETAGFAVVLPKVRG